MTIEVPENCKRLVRAYEARGYTLVQSEHPRHLLKLLVGTGESNINVFHPPVSPIYITRGRSPLSLLNRDPSAGYITSTGNRVPYYTAAERKHAVAIVFGK